MAVSSRGYVATATRVAPCARECGGEAQRRVVLAPRIDAGDDGVGHVALQRIEDGSGFRDPVAGARRRHRVLAADHLRLSTDPVVLDRRCIPAHGARVFAHDRACRVAGGGVGALEALLALQSLAGDRVRITVITPARYLCYSALSVVEPFGADPAPRYCLGRITRDRGVRWMPDAMTGIRPEARELETLDGPPVPYDALVLALGAPAPVLPGAIPSADRATCSRHGRDRGPCARAASLDRVRRGRRRRLDASAVRARADDGRRRPPAGLDLAIELRDAGVRTAGRVRPRGERRRRAAARARRRAPPDRLFATEVATASSGWSWRARSMPTSSSPCRSSPADGCGACRRTTRLRAGRRVRSGARRRPRLGGGGHDVAAAQAGGLAAQQADVAAADIAARSRASPSTCVPTSRSCRESC